MTAEEVLERNIAAIGGREALERVTSYQLKAALEMPGRGVRGTIEITGKAPDRMLSVRRIERVGVIRQGYDGKTGWSEDPYQGMRQLEGEEDSMIKRRGYFVGDAMVLMAMGVASSFISALVLSLYVNTTIAQQSYAAPTLLWLMVPLILFWQCRLWLATTRGHMLDDPILYSAKDWVSWIAFGLIGVVYAVATVGLW